MSRKPHDPYQPAQEALPSHPSSSPPALPPTPLFSARQEAGVHVITFTRTDVLDSYHAEQLGEGLFEHLQRFDAPKVVIDLHDVPLLSSSALGVFVSLNSLIENQGGRLCFANVDSSLLDILKMTKLHTLLEIRGSTEEAIKSLL